MKVVLIGYGKMGQTIDRLCQEDGLEVIARIDQEHTKEERLAAYTQGDVAIEFSHPNAAYENIIEAISAGIPVVSGTTGWLDNYDQVKTLVAETNGAFFYASNYSIGVNIFFAINRRLASLMNAYPAYQIDLTETHHIHKKDEPSGTAKSLAEDAIEELSRKSSWTLDSPAEDQVYIESIREGEIFGDHTVRYQSDIDTIEISHNAHTRDGFAKGAIMAATWMYNHGKSRVGIFGMNDLMGL